MQQKLLHKKFNYVRDIDTTEYSPIVYERKEKLIKIERLLTEGCSEETALDVCTLSRSTYYRLKRNYKNFGLAGLENDSRKPRNTRKPTWSKEVLENVFRLRKEYPFWGKYKIAVMYEKHYGQKISVSMIGRIITTLIKSGRIHSVQFLTGQKEVRPRNFDGWAQPWTPTMKAKIPGELIQIDHTNPRLPSGSMIKHFKATCPITKISYECVFDQATSHNARIFLRYIRTKFPFPIISIQVDGGSEFMGEFEEVCKTDNIPIFVLPPRSPEYNGCVERSNRTVKREFYAQYSGLSTLKAVQASLENFAILYNTVRPHQALKYLTPMEYYEIYLKKEALQSHMS